MLIDTVIIRLIKSGVGIGPDYSLSIYGNGKVLYEGVDKVRIKGIVETHIDSDKVLSLLSEFKDKGFFSLNESYGEEDAGVRPCTKISISFQKEDGQTVTKRVKYCERDVNVPKELVDLEDKIEEIVDTSKWIGKYTELEQKREPEQIAKSTDKTEKLQKKKTSKLITAVAVVAIAIIVTISVFAYSGIFNQPPHGDNIIYDTPKISVLTSASDVRAYRDYDTNTTFNMTQKIWIYEEYTNISTTNNETCDLNLELIVMDVNTSTIRHVNYTHKTEIGNRSQGWFFVPSNEWPTGYYYATATIKDNISNTTATKTTVFKLDI